MLPSAAAMPPSAITVWALPSKDLQTRAVRAPAADDSMAARRPAPPAPMTRTSNSCVSYSANGVAFQLEAAPGVRVRDVTVGHQPDVEIRACHADEACPGPEPGALIPQGDSVPNALACSRHI